MEDHANFDVNKEIVTERKNKQENKMTSSPNWTHTLSRRSKQACCGCPPITGQTAPALHHSGGK